MLIKLQTFDDSSCKFFLSPTVIVAWNRLLIWLNVLNTSSRFRDRNFIPIYLFICTLVRRRLIRHFEKVAMSPSLNLVLGLCIAMVNIVIRFIFNLISNIVFILYVISDYILCLSYTCKASQAIWSKSKPAEAPSCSNQVGWLLITKFILLIGFLLQIAWLTDFASLSCLKEPTLLLYKVKIFI